MNKYVIRTFFRKIFEQRIYADHCMKEHISEDIIRCIVYGNSTNEYANWIEEASNLLVSRIHAKYIIGNISRKCDKYQKYLFSFGETIGDVKYFLYGIESGTEDGRAHLKFDTEDNNLCYKVRAICDNVSGEVSLEVSTSSRRNISAEHLADYLHELLDKHCITEGVL